MKAHIEGLLVAFDFDRRFVRLTGQAKCVWACREVSIPEIKSPVSYASALHEIGHILARHGDSRRCLVRERAAWQWAKAHALTWTESMERCCVSSLAWYGAPGRGGLPRQVVIDRRRAMEDRQDAAIETSQGALLPDLPRTRRGEPIKRRDHDDETLAEIGRSYNVSGWTIARLMN